MKGPVLPIGSENNRHIIESGTSGGWTYDKYSDGTIEAKYVGNKAIAINQSVAGTIQRSGAISFAIPSGLFETIEHREVFAERVGSLMWGAPQAVDSLTTTSGYAFMITSTSYSSITVQFTYKLTGTY